MGEQRAPILYLAPWIDYGGSDKNTIDWFRGIDRQRFAPSLITTQPSPNRRLAEIEEFVEEIWVLPDLMPAERMPAFILDFLSSREIRLIHLMNSRLGFDLLPDISCLPNPPGIVVQLHAEEADKSGYVRYVTTRYEELIDGFSLTMEDLAKAVHEYGVPPEKTKVIYIGVDAEEEFSPDKVEPIEALPGDRMHILFPARLVQQKDPLLMVEVAAALRDRRVSFQLHVLGEGELEDDVRAAIAKHGLGSDVLIHPPTSTPERWYAACDAMLLTSVFEGVPAALFEAMAMAVPVVSPALPGNVELLGADYDGLVEPRDSVEGYAAALARLADDPSHHAADAREQRDRARRRFSLQRMADEHGELYEEVLRDRVEPSANTSSPPAIGSPDLSIVSLRPTPGAPLDPLRQARLEPHGRFMAVTSSSAEELLAEPAFAEKVLRRFDASNGALDAIALVDVGAQGRFAFRALTASEASADAIPHTVVWRIAAEKQLPRGLLVDSADPAQSIARLFCGSGAQVEWRHLPSPRGSQPGSPSGSWTAVDPPADGPSSSPLLPGQGRYRIPRWEGARTWIPTRSTLAVRYRERRGERRIVTSGPAPAGFEEEHLLGALRSTNPVGTEQLLRVDDGYLTVPAAEMGLAPKGGEEIGYVEQAPFPQLDCLALAVHRTTGQPVLVTLPDDPILDQVDVVRTLGFIEPIPLKPREVPDAHWPVGLVGLVKAVDYERRRHRYAIGALPSGELVGELGALAESDLQGTVAAWVVDGLLVTERHRPPVARPRSTAAVRWTLEPTTWRGIASPNARARAMVRRGSIAATRIATQTAPVAPPDEEPAGWLFEAERPGLVALHAAYHPVTGDQLLTRSPQDAAAMGYANPEPIGFIRLIAPQTGDLMQRVFHVPWARRFGAVPRTG